MDVAIIGYGIVGKHLYDEIKSLSPEIYDKYLKLDNRSCDKYDIAFICVDTPLKEESGRAYLDTSEISNAIEETDADIYVIKSTIPISYCFLLSMKTNKKIIHSPEYYGNTQHCNNFDFNFTILGGNREVCIKVQQALQNCYDARHTFHITDSKTAALVKLMENSWIATKVSFCNQFYEFAELCNIDYEELRELFILDPRVNPSHTFVYRDHPYWDSHCLNKDVAALADQFTNAEFINSVISFNNCQKRNHL